MSNAIIQMSSPSTTRIIMITHEEIRKERKAVHHNVKSSPSTTTSSFPKTKVRAAASQFSPRGKDIFTRGRDTAHAG